MNNTKYYTNNLAYDFDMFLPKEKRQEDLPGDKVPDNIVRMPTISGKAGALRREKTAKKNRVFAIVTSALLIAMVCCSIFIRAQVTEVDTQITSAKKQLSELQSEGTSLEMKLEEKISFTNIEQAAEALGMQKKDKSQVTYIQTGGTSWAEVVGDQTQTAEND